MTVSHGPTVAGPFCPSYGVPSTRPKLHRPGNRQNLAWIEVRAIKVG